jgi:WD40 repeat protein
VHSESIEDITFSLDGKSIVANSYDSSVLLSEYIEGYLQTTLEGHGCKFFACFYFFG